MKLTRRQVAPAILLPAMLEAQNRPAPEAELQAARDRQKANSGALSAVNVPMDTEPAFQFKA